MKNARGDFIPLAYFFMTAGVNNEIGEVDNEPKNVNNLHYNSK